MRLDLFLHRVCLVKSRTLAKEACDRGRVTVNGEKAKGAHVVRAGERVRCDLGSRIVEIEVTAVPEGQVSKKDAPTFYRVLSDERVSLEL